MRIQYLVPVLFLLWSCGSDESGPGSFSQSVAEVEAFDLGDENDSQDIRLDLILTEGHQLTGLRAFIVPNSDQGSVTTEAASDLSASSFSAIAITGDTITARLGSGLTDWNGEAVSNGNAYQIMLLMVSEDREELSPMSAEVTLTEAPYLSGRYVGLWNDNIYTDFGISAELTFENDTLSGPFYYSNNYSPCCGGSNDGRIEVAFDGHSVTFFYDQDLLTFMGGCPGEYDGSGNLVEDIVLEINFTGEDCEGPHTNGRIVLTRDLKF